MKILLVDDHPIVRRGMKSILESEGNYIVCGEAEDANGALKIIGEVDPDLAIVDIELKGSTNGIELTKAIKERYPNIVTLVMSIDDGTLYAERAIRAGARGYIAKEEASEKILSAIEVVMDGKLYLSSEISTRIAAKHILSAGDALTSQVDRLSNRELEVFRLIGQGYKRGEIAKKLSININTIESHRRKIKEKLNVQSSAELSRVAVQWNVTQTRKR